MTKVNVTVSIADSHLNQVLEVTDNLRAAGLEVDQVMDAIGVITGTSEAEQVSALSSVTGVAHVEQSRTFQLPPPDSPIQ